MMDTHRWLSAGMWFIMDVCYMATAFNTREPYFMDWIISVFQNSSGMGYLVTVEDRDAFITTTAYIVYYTFRFEVRCMQSFNCSCEYISRAFAFDRFAPGRRGKLSLVFQKNRPSNSRDP